MPNKKGAIISMSRKGTQAKPKDLADTTKCVDNSIKFWNNT